MHIEIFNEVEKKYNLCEQSIEGYSYWIYLREAVAGAIEQEVFNSDGLQGNISTSPQKTDKTAAWNKRLKKIKNILLHSYVRPKHFDYVVLNHCRRVLVDGTYDCIYTEDLIQKLGSAIVLEDDYNGDHFRPIRTANIIYTDITNVYAYIYCSVARIIFSKKFKEYKKNIYHNLKQPIAELSQRYGVNVSIDNFVMNALYGLYIYKVEKLYYRRQLKKFTPKAIIEVVSYSRHCKIINEIAKEMEIPSIELQHGAIGNEHFAYNYPFGYNIKQFPKYILLFSEFWINKSSFPIPKQCLMPVGYPYLEKMSTYSVERKENKKNILFLSSEPVGKMLSSIAIELSEKLDMDKYSIHFKLHPKEYAKWRDLYPNLIGRNIEIYDTPAVNLYELFLNADFQVSGAGSTTIFEGLFFSLPTFVLKQRSMSVINDLYEAGYINFFETGDDLIKLIYTVNVSNVSNGEALWKCNGLKNMCFQIEKIIDRENSI